MEALVSYETHPVFVLSIAKEETELDGIDAVVAHFRSRIDAHRCARFIGIFDHLAHTRSLPDGEVAEGILAARNVIFCFGMSIPSPDILAWRPRSIGIAELADRFVVSFLEPPMPLVNAAMESWALQLVRPRQAPRPSGRSDGDSCSETTRIRHGGG
jgi:hypothetical protein